MNHRVTRIAIAGSLAAVTMACADITRNGADFSPGELGAALSSVPVGYGDLSTSFVGIPASNAESAGLWVGGGREASFDRGGLMGGGLHDAFAGSIGFTGRGGKHGPFAGGLSCRGTFNAATGRVTCTDTTRSGVIVTHSARYTTTAGVVQQAFDTLTTNTVNLQSTSAGTISYTRGADSGTGRGKNDWGRGRGHGGRLLGDTSTILTATTVVSSSSDRTVGGLASGSTQRTVSSASAGRENTTGTSSKGAFTASRVVGDTTTGLVIPVVTGATSYPTAGTVIRSLNATLQYTGATATTLTRREVITYDGSATAKVVITEKGVTRTCTRPLPQGRLTCA